MTKLKQGSVTSSALVTVIESDKVNIDSNNTSFTRYFEREAVLAFTYWRKNGGVYKDIPIYAICITKNTISDATKAKFNELNVVYIEEYLDITDTFDCGFYNKPLGCKLLENIVTEDWLIHIDLDMYLMREPVIEFINSCMVYDSTQQQFERIHRDKRVIDTYNTCYMVTRREDFVFTTWWGVLESLLARYNEEEFNKLYSNLEYRKLEELSFDLLSLELPIKNIPNSLFGETYTPLSNLRTEELAQVFFHHYHIYDTLKEYNWLEGIKEYKRLCLN